MPARKSSPRGPQLGRAPKQYPPRQPKLLGRPHKPTEDTRARAFVAFGMRATVAGFAAVLRISEDAVRAHYADEIANAPTAFDTRLLINAGTHAMRGDKSMLMFLLKAVVGLKETTAHEHSGPGGGPIALDYDPRELSDEELDARIQALAVVAAAPSPGRGANPGQRARAKATKGNPH